MNTRSLRLVTALGAAAALLAACTSTTGGGSADASQPGPGVTDTTVKVGFITLKNASGAGGFIVADQGDATAQVNAMVSSINASGGIAGRKVEPVVIEYDATTDSAQSENALCTKFTQDNKVFAVVAQGQREPSARTCYKNANTLLIDVSGIALASAVYNELAPYLWAPGNTTLDIASKSMVDTLNTEGFFTGAKLGVLIEKDPQYQAVYDKTLKPALDAVGATVTATGEIDQSNASNAGATVGASAAKFKNAGVTAVMFLGRPDNVGYFTAIAGPQKFYPRLAIGSFESPEFAAANNSLFGPVVLKDAVGIGFDPPVDGTGTSYPFPAPGAEQSCIDVYSAAGITFAGRPEANRALRYCDGLGFLKAAAAKIDSGKPLNAQNLATGAAALGTTWQSATALGTTFGAGVYAPSSAKRTLKYVGPAFTYVGDNQPLGS